MFSSNYTAVTHNVIPPFAHQHAALPTPLPSTTLLCTQLTKTNHSWQNDTRCIDGVKVLWCHSLLVWLVFEGSIPHALVFAQKTFLWLHYIATYVMCAYLHDLRGGCLPFSCYLSIPVSPCQGFCPLFNIVYFWHLFMPRMFHPTVESPLYSSHWGYSTATVFIASM